MHRPADNRLSPLLGPAQETYDQCVHILSQIEPVIAQPATKPSDVRQVAEFHPDDGGRHSGCGLDIESNDPSPERAAAIFADTLINEHNALT